MKKKIVSVVLAVIMAAIIIFIEGGILLKSYANKHDNSNKAAVTTVAGNISINGNTNKLEF